MPNTNPYIAYKYESERFLLRQVDTGDAADLLECYRDPAAVARMNADNCQRGFLCQTLEEMLTYIDYWRDDGQGMYIRPAVIDKEIGRAVPGGRKTVFLKNLKILCFQGAA